MTTRSTDDDMLLDEQEGNVHHNNNNNQEPSHAPSSSPSFLSQLISSTHLSHLFLPMSSLTTQQQQLRRRLILSITITLVIITVHLLIFIIFFSSYNKYTANGASGEEGPNLPLPIDPGEDDDGDDTDSDKSRRTLFTYLITIPNLIFLFLMSCCVLSLCLRKLLVKYLQSSDSSLANRLRNRLLIFGVYISGPRDGNFMSSGDDELGRDSNNTGPDLYHLHLSMVDRDFDENDYEALLALDDNNVIRNRIASEYDLKRSLVSYTIPPGATLGFVNNKMKTDDGAIEMMDNSATMVELGSMDDDSVTDREGLLSNFEQDEPNIHYADRKAVDDYCTMDEAMRLLEKQCVICLEDFKSGDSISHLRTCPHEFHTGCISEALKVKAICPICKAEAL